eukprot:RCo040935
MALQTSLQAACLQNPIYSRVGLGPVRFALTVLPAFILAHTDFNEGFPAGAAVLFGSEAAQLNVQLLSKDGTAFPAEAVDFSTSVEPDGRQAVRAEFRPSSFRGEFVIAVTPVGDTGAAPTAPRELLVDAHVYV